MIVYAVKYGDGSYKPEWAVDGVPALSLADAALYVEYEEAEREAEKHGCVIQMCKLEEF